MIDGATLCGLIPHSGAMCLLQEVLEWDDDHIVCTSSTHRDANNPLRRDGRLATLHGVEYGAQAAALQAALGADAERRAPRPGYLAAVRDVRIAVPTLDRYPAPLEVGAARLMASADAAMYAIVCSAMGRELLRARITVGFAQATES